METRANYTVIGIFTLAVIAAAFVFVYWFAGPKDSDKRKLYEVLYQGSVSGLREGNAVLFNGIPVGQVTKLGLVPGAPNEVLVQIGVRNDVPILADARASLESQGITGIVAVSIQGGNAKAGPIPPGPNGLPRIEALGGTGMAGLLQNAQGTVAKVNSILDAIDPDQVRQIVANVENVSKQLSDNSGDIASMISGVKDAVAQVNEIAKKVDVVVVNLQHASGDKDGLLNQATEAATAVRKLADNLDQRTALLTNEISRFTGPGLRQYEALAADGRRTLTEIERVFRNLERNPRQFIFGGNSIPEYNKR
ncbi:MULTISPECIES: MlaD family protein [Azorhizobium]|uniref:ABC-type transport system protein n=1 Tax=Azorhizobium caulinodans (strain ATCC 43989 / DSM 5975 / JCM 20966 / LMG 6465 / NBRC 14845 / NCIMB 13405 / ORS 571) TaxID=438753 RepID=A8I863_AZOC5|nr:MULTISPECIES: MlaD family protein [Azorhizobium]TDT99369.1 phospholipid/cholesterol/gamma-HCH transport system substrate-binding protein [Azorhizobium sp. AG788]BAF88213.1 ABC-type transport system protein [Azorhizobium caulinodans ORS 571]